MDNIQTHQKELCNKLWSMANALRGNMEAYEFKNYILGMIFYYYLSDRTEKYMAKILHDDGLNYEEAWNDSELKEAVIEESLRDLGFVIEPQYLFRKMVHMVENRSFDIEFLQKAINSLMASTQGNESEEDFDGLFSDMQLDSTKLGHTVKDRSSVMAKIISALDEIEFGVEDTKIDILGNAYEYLIGQFAATAGKKAGEFYPVYDAAGIAGYIDYYDIDSDYITIVKDGSGVGRLQKCDKKSSFIGTLGALVAKNCTLNVYGRANMQQKIKCMNLLNELL